MAITKIQKNAFPTSIDLSNVDLTIGANEIVTANIADSAVHTNKIADTAVTHAKLHTDMDLSGKTVTLPSLNQTLIIDRSSSNGTPIADFSTNKSQGEFSKLRFYNAAYSSSVPMATISAQVPTANVYGRLDFKVNSANVDETVMSLYEGKVGIGYAEPANKLSVQGVISSGNFTGVSIGGTPADANTAELGPGYLNLARDDTVTAKQILFGKNGSVHSYLETSTSGLNIGGTNVGIGTASPQTILHINSSNPEIRFQPASDTDTSRIRFRNAADNSSRGQISYDHNSQEMRLNVLGDHVFLHSSGNVDIGRNEDNAMLHVENTSNNRDADVKIFKASGDNSDIAALYVGYDENACLKIYRPRADGNIYIDHTQNDNLRFQFGGASRYILNNIGFYPDDNDSRDLGTSSQRWANVYTNDLHLSNMTKENGNDVDGTNGDWTIQEGQEDLFLINNVTGKKYKINMTEVG